MNSVPAPPQRALPGSSPESESVEEQGEHAGTTTPPVEAHTPSHRLIPRSCHACNRKKIRCNKREPCSACTRAGRPCEYPAAGPRIRRPKKTIIADMSSRISDLERALAKARNFNDVTQSPHWNESVTITNQQKAALHSEPSDHGSRGDIVVQKGSSSQYFNEILLSRVIDEVMNPPRAQRSYTQLF